MWACRGALHAPAVPTGNGHQPKHIRLPLNTRNHLFYCVGSQTLARVVQKAVESLSAVTQTPAGCGCPCLGRGCSAWHPRCLRPELFCKRGRRKRRGRGKKRLLVHLRHLAASLCCPPAYPCLPTSAPLPLGGCTSLSPQNQP